MLSSKLKALGYENVKPALKSVAFSATDKARSKGRALLQDGSITVLFPVQCG